MAELILSEAGARAHEPKTADDIARWWGKQQWPSSATSNTQRMQLLIELLNQSLVLTNKTVCDDVARKHLWGFCWLQSYQILSIKIWESEDIAEPWGQHVPSHTTPFVPADWIGQSIMYDTLLGSTTSTILSYLLCKAAKRCSKTTYHLLLTTLGTLSWKRYSCRTSAYRSTQSGRHA